MTTRIRIPAGRAVAAGVYRVNGTLATSDGGDHVDLAPFWDELRKSPQVAIECPRHSDRWWPTAGQEVPLAGLATWRCPTCAWEFREGLKGRGGTPQF